MSLWPCLLYPKAMQLKNRLCAKTGGMGVKAIVLGCMGAVFWAAIFFVFYRVLIYFKGIDVLGTFLAAKLLAMILLTFFSILLFSNIITAIATCFMSEELHLIISSPYDVYGLYFAKLLETLFNSSWMVLLFSLPVFFSYGLVFEQGLNFYGLVGVVLIPFVVIAGTLGTGIALALVVVFPARRLKDFLFLASIVLVVGFYMLLRMLRPERLLDPDAFFTVIDYLASLETPGSPFLPSQWVTDILCVPLFHHGAGETFFLTALLWVSACALVFLLNRCFNSYHFMAWSKAQEGRSARITGNPAFGALLRWLMACVPLRFRSVVDKDIRVFFRDTSQWSQLLILGAIIIIYLYNFSVLPLEKSPIPTLQLQNLLGFLNLGLAGFVIAAVAVRFAYPSVSLEGESFWIIRSSPLSLKGFLWCKFILNAFFLCVLAGVLIVFSNRLLRVEPFMMWLSLGTILLMTLCLTSLSIGLGAMYPRFSYNNIAQIPTGFGGLMYMILAVVYVGAVIVLEAWPVHMLLMANMTGQPLTPVQIAAIIASLAAVILISCVVLVAPLKIGLHRITSLDDA